MTLDRNASVSPSLLRRLLDPRFPFDPSRLPFFYGWVVALLSTAGVLASIPGQTMGLSVFTDSVLGATGFSRLGFSNAYLVGTVASGLMLPLGGQWIDRFGVRPVALFACTVLGATLVLLSSVDGMIAFFGWSAGGAAAALLMCVLFFLLRFSGQGLLTLTSRTMLGRWFERRRGLVAAGSGALVGFGFSAAPLILLWWIERSGWRGAWREMAFLLLVAGVVAVLLFRDRPEDVGLEIDGGANGKDLQVDEDLERAAEGSGLDVRGWDVGGGASAEVPEEHEMDVAVLDVPRAVAIRTFGFWLLTVTISIQALVGTALTFHIVDLGAEHGMAAQQAVRLFLPMSVVSIGVGFLVGWLVDRAPMMRLVQLMLVAEVFAFLGPIYLSTLPGKAAMVIGWGIAGGCYGPLTVAALPRLFGRTHLGAISGVMTMCLVIASALGPAIFAFSRSVSGSYETALWGSVALPAGLLAVTLVSQWRGQDLFGAV